MSDIILVIQTGGTIDKCYPKTIRGYSFEIGEPAVDRVLDRVKPTFCVEVKSVCRKDSQDIQEEERLKIIAVCREHPANKILITHGTDTMIETAKTLAKHGLNKTIVLTGSFLPETFKDSDADFNIGFGFGVLQTLDTKDVFVAMNGCLSHWSRCERHPDNNRFYSS